MTPRACDSTAAAEVFTTDYTASDYFPQQTVEATTRTDEHK